MFSCDNCRVAIAAYVNKRSSGNVIGRRMGLSRCKSARHLTLQSALTSTPTDALQRILRTTKSTIAAGSRLDA